MIIKQRCKGCGEEIRREIDDSLPLPRIIRCRCGYLFRIREDPTNRECKVPVEVGMLILNGEESEEERESNIFEVGERY